MIGLTLLWFVGGKKHMDSAAKGPEDDNKDEAESLESTSTTVENADGTTSTNVGGDAEADAAPAAAAPPPKKHFLQRINIYLLLFIFVIVLAGVITAVVYLYSKNAENKDTTIKTQTLSQDALDQLANSDVTVGDSKQVLSVQANAVFAGKVLVRDSVEIANGLKIGGTLSLNGIKSTGSSTFDDVQVSRDLAVTGNTSVQGQLLVQKTLNVNGGATFNGNVSTSQLTTNSLQLSGNLTVTRHIVVGGANPGRSNGGALGGGGTSSVSGSDTAGSITVNTGSSPGTDCFITVNFTSRFGSTPHVVITPVGSAAGGLAYYVNRSTTSFSVCTDSAAPAGASFGFDYIVIG
jgi:cytoskeletal protein CcmA (bactofilin family)